MSASSSPDAALLVKQALQAMRRKDRREARRLAEAAVRIDPAQEEAWLVLAAIASPQASLYYLGKALEANPHSERARQGMHWAVKRLRKSGQESAKAAALTGPFHPGISLPMPGGATETQPIALRMAQARSFLFGAPGAKPRPALVVGAAALFVMAVLFVFLAFNSSWVVMARSGANELDVAALFKPSLTPTNTATP
ncbi:MAG: hypothetical protein HY835_05030, partial [Anaerolineae bacterium]|nr:hypothetical protein [Anaerolineae bacterium]